MNQILYLLKNKKYDAFFVNSRAHSFQLFVLIVCLLQIPMSAKRLLRAIYWNQMDVYVVEESEVQALFYDMGAVFCNLGIVLLTVLYNWVVDVAESEEIWEEYKVEEKHMETPELMEKLLDVEGSI